MKVDDKGTHVINLDVGFARGEVLLLFRYHVAT